VTEIGKRRPSVITPVSITLPDGENVTIRRLSESDADAFAQFLESLSAETRRLYRPHALDESEARRICAVIHTDPSLRLIATPEGGDQISAYVLAEFEIPDDEKGRYAGYGIVLEDSLDCRIAPGVADRWQDRGLGSVMLRHALAALHLLGLRYVVLFGGTQAGNSRAIHVYSKLGFRPLGTFETKGIENVDMWIPELAGRGIGGKHM
jgi:RimJ/RimL family protein N-acetyltransferase